MSSPFISEENPFRKFPDRTETPRKHKDVTMAIGIRFDDRKEPGTLG